MTFEIGPFDYSDSVDFQAPAQNGNPNGRVTATREQRLLVLMLNEVQNLAPLIIAATSVVNQLVQDSCGALNRNSLMAYLPPDPKPSRTLADLLVQSDLATDLLADAQEFHARLGTARVMTMSFCQFPAEEHQKGRRSCGSSGRGLGRSL